MIAESKPLSGYRVVELSTFVAAPSCGRILADWGADVIKVDSPSGDVFRHFGQVMNMPANEAENPAWDMFNGNKRGMTIDLKTRDGRAVLGRLLETADVFLTNMRPTALKKMNLDYESLKEKYPRLVLAHVTGFGEHGPDAELPGFDVAAYWARSGFLLDLVKPDEYPIYSPAAFGDLTVGTTLFGGICAALLNREKTGRGDKISISLYGAAVWFAGLLILSTQKKYGNQFPKTRTEGNPLAIPYKCRDNEWIILSLIDMERYFKTLCNAINRSELIDDDRFKSRSALLQHKKELIVILDGIFLTKSSTEWVLILRKEGMVVERLSHFREVTEDPQAWANSFLYHQTFANGSMGAIPCPPLCSEAKGPLLLRRGPFDGEHTQDIMKELGYSEDKIDEMRKSQSIHMR